MKAEVDGPASVRSALELEIVCVCVWLVCEGRESSIAARIH